MANPNVSNIGAFIKAAVGTVPAAASAGTRDGTGIDRRGFASCVLHGQIGAVTGAPSAQTADFKIQDSADNSTFADYVPPVGNGAAAATAATAQLTAINTAAKKDIDLSSAKRYVRVREVTTLTAGTTPTIGVSSVVILGGAQTKPAA